MASEHQSIGFAKVLSDELQAIRKRRELNGFASQDSGAAADQPPADDGSDQAQQADESDLSREHRVRRQALEEDLVGLCFSGGGIRSATFNLGVLHGLADLGLLTRIDYLSTVSGGGYIGSWLSAWIKREGKAENVERQLQSSRTRQATAERRGAERGEVFDADPEPICHLRAFSNYLTPRLGLLSVDAWVLGSIYVRNLLLNLLVLVPFLLALIMSERLLILTFIRTTDLRQSGLWERVVWCCGLGLYLVLMVVIFVWIRRSMDQIRAGLRGKFQPKQYHLERRYLHRYVLIPCLVLSILSTWLAYGHLQFEAEKIGDNFPVLKYLFGHAPWLASQWFPYLVAGTTMGLIFGVFHWLTAFDHVPGTHAKYFLTSLRFRLVRLGLGTMTGFVGGLILYYTFHRFQRHDSTPWHAALLTLTFGPPLFLLALNLVAWLQVGLISRLWSEAIREWWASLTGSSLIYVSGWIVIFGLSIWGPWVILEMEQRVKWIDSALLAGWGTTMGGGLLAIRNSAIGKDSLLRRGFLRLLPYVFLIGLTILTSFIADFFMLPVGRAASPEAYLDAVENQNEYFRFMPLVVAGLFLIAAFASSRIDVNSFGMHALYRNRLVRCFLGASREKAKFSDGGSATWGAPTNVRERRPRAPNPLTGFDPLDDLPLATLDADCCSRIASRRESLEAEIGQLQQKVEGLMERWRPIRWYLRPQYLWKIRLIKQDLQRLPPADNHTGPYHVICTALNLVHGGELAWQERKAESFAMTPRYCGSTSTGYSPTDEYSAGVTVGQAVSISGAAVSPNMGYHSRGPMTALLAIFNMRLGAWLGNPCRSSWKSPGPRDLLKYFGYELLGLTNAAQDYVYLSDGGHFENLALYELLRRRCRFIVVSDSGADPDFTFQDLGGVIRKARIDFGIGIDIDVEDLRPIGDQRLSQCHVAVGKIYYGHVDRRDRCENERRDAARELAEEERDRRGFHPECDDGLLIYIKPTITGDETQDVLNYRTASPAFPHEPTTDQWFGESQFESYRALGWHIARTVFAPAAGQLSSQQPPAQQQRELFTLLYDHWSAAKAVGQARDPQPPTAGGPHFDRAKASEMA